MLYPVIQQPRGSDFSRLEVVDCRSVVCWVIRKLPDGWHEASESRLLTKNFIILDHILRMESCPPRPCTQFELVWRHEAHWTMPQCTYKQQVSDIDHWCLMYIVRMRAKTVASRWIYITDILYPPCVALVFRCWSLIDNRYFARFFKIILLSLLLNTFI